MFYLNLIRALAHLEEDPDDLIEERMLLKRA